MADVKPTKVGQQVLYLPSRFEKQPLKLADQLPAIAVDADTHPTLTIFTGNPDHPFIVKRTVSYKGEAGCENGSWEEMPTDVEPTKKEGKK